MALSPVVEGDRRAFSSAGAYSFVMASTYNSRPLVPEVMVRGDRHAVVRPRINYETMIGQDCLPDWLEQDSSPTPRKAGQARKSEEHTSELQSLMRISYAVFCLKKKNNLTPNSPHNTYT